MYRSEKRYSSFLNAPPKTQASPPNRDQDGRLSMCARLLISMLVGGFLLSETQARAQSDAPPTIKQMRAARDEGQYPQAVEMLLQISKSAKVDHSIDFVLLARKAAGHLAADQVDKLYLAAIASLQHSDPTPKNHSQRLLIRTAVANHFLNQGNSEQAAKILPAALDELAASDPQATADRAKPLLALAMQTAGSELARSELGSQHSQSAETIYLKLIDLCGDDRWADSMSSGRAIAMLGLGWATAMQSDRNADAAQRLMRFIESFPDHHDVPQAAAQRIRCLQKSKQASKADDAITDFLDRWPSSPHAQEFAWELLSRDLEEQDDSLGNATMKWILADGASATWPAELVGVAMVRAGPKLSPTRFDELLQRLAAEDKTGHQTAVVLNDATNASQGAFAEQVAATLISGDLENCSNMARESACRWAGRTGRWSLLALAAESEDISRAGEKRTGHVERLFAEALTQMGQSRQALVWWSHVVDQRDATDFATLLRCAECAVASSDIAESTRRLSDARRALADTNPSGSGAQEALLDLLESDLAVRQLNFSHARSLLERIVRGSGSNPALRGRAQWMIGETHFMQRQFPKAIDAYRQVEGLDPGGAFIAAALVQAGKSFEQLGRTREAGVCYGTLLGRFADSSHAFEAKHRMAALPSRGPNGSPKQPNTVSPDSTRLRR